MSNKKEDGLKKGLVVCIIGAVLLMGILMVTPKIGAGDAPLAGYDITVVTDKAFYSPGETVNISGYVTYNGAGVPDIDVGIQVKDPDGGNVFTDSKISDSNGYYSTEYLLSGSAKLGQYTVYVAGSRIGASNTTTFNVTTNIAPTANFTYTPSSPTTADTIQFTDTSTDVDGTIVSWSWQFGDGVTSTLQNSTHQYSSAGTYLV
ncbi:MAG: MG2 domain-containing protein, partial [Thermoplasmatales archaeon]|nr:MG2 domain-containing protein [Thermoplasmatales archaeon]